MNLVRQTQTEPWYRSRGAIIALAVGGVLLIVYYMGRKSAKGYTVAYPATKEQDGISPDYANKVVPGIINEMFEAFDGLSADVDAKTLAIKPLLGVTDNQLVYIFNRYNQRYLAGKNETLYTVIDGEYFGPIGEAAKTKTKVLKRMRDLKLDRQ